MVYKYAKLTDPDTGVITYIRDDKHFIILPVYEGGEKLLKWVICDLFSGVIISRSAFAEVSEAKDWIAEKFEGD